MQITDNQNFKKDKTMSEFRLIDENSVKIANDVMRKIVLSMNGEVSEQMENLGMEYRKNYGVAVPRLKQIAASFPHDKLLAMELWNRKIRESMIMATLLAPVDQFNRANALKWIGEITGPEMAEQLSMNLLSKLPFCGLLAVELTSSGDEWERITGFMTAIRIYTQLIDNEARVIIKNGFASDVENSYFLAVSVARSVGRMSRKNSAIAGEIAGLLREYEANQAGYRKLVVEEVKQELNFLKNL